MLRMLPVECKYTEMLLLVASKSTQPFSAVASADQVGQGAGELLSRRGHDQECQYHRGLP
jgi:hypothetical protein